MKFLNFAGLRNVAGVVENDWIREISSHMQDHNVRTMTCELGFLPRCSTFSNNQERVVDVPGCGSRQAACGILCLPFGPDSGLLQLIAILPFVRDRTFRYGDVIIVFSSL